MIEKNILVLGSSGFLGKNLCNVLKSKSLKYFEITGKNFLNLESSKKLNKFLIKNNISTIINCSAFVGGIKYGYNFPADLLLRNTNIINNIYSSSIDTNVKHIINPISNCAYPESIVEYKEQSFWEGKPHSSVFFYGIAKRHIVALSDGFLSQYGISSTNVVLSNMYGPFDHFEEERSHALGALIKKIYHAKLTKSDYVEIWGTGKPIREWLFVEDGAKALIKSIDLKNRHNFFNVGINSGISVIALAKLIANNIGYEGEFVLDKSKPDGVLQKTVNGDYGSVQLNWKPEVDLIKGIEITVNWYINNYEQLYK